MKLTEKTDYKVRSSGGILQILIVFRPHEPVIVPEEAQRDGKVEVAFAYHILRPRTAFAVFEADPDLGEGTAFEGEIDPDRNRGIAQAIPPHRQVAVPVPHPRFIGPPFQGVPNIELIGRIGEPESEVLIHAE